jgi:hypothetical protein
MADPVKTLCLQCGLCCNGVLFADVRREPADGSILFVQHGPRVPQPCPAFKSGDCTCTIYAERPARCRKFECKQLLAVKAGGKTIEAALRRIGEARKLAGKVDRLLIELGFAEMHLPLNKRFQRCQKAAEQGKIVPEKLDQLAELQLAFHRLNGLLAQHFYA